MQRFHSIPILHAFLHAAFISTTCRAMGTATSTASATINSGQAGQCADPTSGECGEIVSLDRVYPGTAVQRMESIRKRVQSLSPDQLNGDWASTVRPALLWAGGLVDDRRLTGHAFNDWNHCDLTAMQMLEAHNENEGRVAGMHQANRLGSHIVRGSIETGTGAGELGPGGSWSTCMMGCNQLDPSTGEGGRDVAHVQFKARIAFKLVWVPPAFTSFVLVDDSGGNLLPGVARPTGQLPHPSQRAKNYGAVKGSQYATAADSQ